MLASAEEYKSVAEAVADCTLVVGTTAARDRELHHPLKLLPDGAPLIRKRLRSGRVALLFGSEKRGLSNADLSHCHWLMRVPTPEEHVSMNLAQAVAVCLYELARVTTTKKTTPTSKAAAGEVERITDLLIQALSLSGYVKAGAAPATEEKVRRLVRRLDIPASDTETWLGMLRQIRWKLRSSN